jgi:hypothetical protein
MITTGRVKSITTATAFLVLLAGQLEGQSERILYANASQLKVDMALDQTTYFPGEAASLMITVTAASSLTSSSRIRGGFRRGGYPLHERVRHGSNPARRRCRA